MEFQDHFFLRDGTFATFRRASDRPIAIACFLLLTFLPERPDFSVPCFLSCIARLTLLDALGPYFRLEAFLPIAILLSGQHPAVFDGYLSTIAIAPISRRLNCSWVPSEDVLFRLHFRDSWFSTARES